MVSARIVGARTIVVMSPVLIVYLGIVGLCFGSFLNVVAYRVPLGRSVIVGDSSGYVHLLSREDGSLLTRLATDGSPVAAAPVLAGNTLVVVTRSGGIYGFVPE